MAVAPEYPRLARANRGFLERAVRLVAGAGVRQFIDLGTGIPTSPSVHEVATAADPSARVMHIDNDPIVSVHNDALLANAENVRSIQADIRRPDEILGHPALRELIDFAEPVAVLLVEVLHVIPDSADPAGIVARFTERLGPGSYLVLSQLASDGDPRPWPGRGPPRRTPRSRWPSGRTGRSWVSSTASTWSSRAWSACTSGGPWPRPSRPGSSCWAGSAVSRDAGAVSPAARPAGQPSRSSIPASSSVVGTRRSACTHSWSMTAE